MTRQRRLWIVLVLNVTLLGLLVFVGVKAGSLGLLAAAGDYIADVGAIALALLAIGLKERHAHDGRYDKAPTWAALVNVALLMILVAGVIVEAVRRLVSGAFDLNPVPMIWTAVIAAVFMTVGALILGGDADDEDDTAADTLNMRAVLLDTIADAVSAAAVAISGIIVLLSHGWMWLDSVVAVVIALVVGYHALELLRDVRRDLTEK